jgi:hypothetical protein
MIDERYGKYYLGCDGCQYEIDEPEESFEEAVEAIKDYGWSTKRNESDTDWLNYCQDCKE